MAFKNAIIQSIVLSMEINTNSLLSIHVNISLSVSQMSLYSHCLSLSSPKFHSWLRTVSPPLLGSLYCPFCSSYCSFVEESSNLSCKILTLLDAPCWWYFPVFLRPLCFLSTGDSICRLGYICLFMQEHVFPRTRHRWDCEPPISVTHFRHQIYLHLFICHFSCLD